LKLMGRLPWYHEGLQFECQGCGQCCTGDPGYVWVSGDEIAALAKALGWDAAEFEEVFVRPVGKRKSLLERPGGDCVLFDSQTRRCKVYEARPAQCRTWPFWASNVRSLEAWQDACRHCPGSGRGRLVPCEEVAARVAEIRV
jgi:uncharacterized protein